jgi:hypothetical protein
MQSKRDIDDFLEEVKKFTKASQWFTPLNLEQEREKFLENSKKNPHFTYEEIPIKKAEVFLKQLEQVILDGFEFIEKRIYKRRMEEQKLKLQMMLNRGRSTLSKISLELYQCDFDKKTLREAKKDADLPAKFKSYEDMGTDEIIEGIKKYLKGYKISDWRVERSELTDFYIRIEQSNKRVLVSKSFNWDFNNFDNTLAHEIDGHVLRTVNMKKQKPPFNKPLPFYIKTEEGLASFLGDYCSTTNEVSRKHHAVKYLAGKLSLEADFLSVYEFFIEKGFTPDLAFQRTFRLKRGFEDTALPGVFAKEAVYYEGMIEVKEYIDSGKDIKELYSAKSGLDDLRYVPLISHAIIPQRIQKYLDKTMADLR